MCKLLGMQSSASAPDVLQRLVDILEVVSLENTPEAKQLLEAASKLLRSTVGERREETIAESMAEYKAAPGVMIAACSTYTNQCLREKCLSPLSDDERQELDVIVPNRR